MRAVCRIGAAALFGFAAATWTKAVKAGRVIPRAIEVWTAEEALAKSKSRTTIKRHLLKAGIIVNRCDWCGLTEWRGRPLSIQIDHVNGIRDDHRVENPTHALPELSQSNRYVRST